MVVQERKWPARSHQEVEDILRGKGNLWEMKDMVIRGIPSRVYANAPNSLRDLWLSTTVPFASRDYIVYEDERYTYAQAHAKIIAIAHLLQSYSVQKGDTVVIVARNLPEWIFSFWAISSLGAVTVAVNAWLPIDALLHCVTFVNPKVCLFDNERAQIFKDHVGLINKSGSQNTLVFKSNVLPQGMKSWDAEVKKFEGKHLELPKVDIEPEDLATIFFTSGTTGLPKGVVGTQRNILSNTLNTLVAGARMILRTGDDLPAPDPNAQQKAMLVGTPLFHATGTHSGLTVVTALGGKTCILFKWDAKKAVDLILKERITHVSGLPLLAMELLDSALHGKKHEVESISYGGGPVSDQLPKSLLEKFPTIASGQGWGLTEVSSAACLVAGRDYLDKPKSTGPAVPTIDIKIVDDNYNTLAVGKNSVGEICIKGANLTVGYYKDEKATKAVYLADGWFKTGDIGYLDEERFLYILDRAKDIIIRGGENIDSSTIESAIYSDYRILDAAAVPVKDDKYGEVVAVAVTTKVDYHGKVSEKELIDLVASKLPKHCIPVLVDVRSEMLPKNGVGKTVKMDLKVQLGKIWLERNGSSGRKAKL